MLDEAQQAIVDGISASNPGWRLETVAHAAGFFVFRQPTPQEYRMFTSQILDPMQQALAYTNLLVATCVHPEKADVAKAVTSYPGLPSNKRIIGALNRLSGSEDAEQAKG